MASVSIPDSSRVRILFDDGVCEEVTVSFVGECLCRLEETPMASTTAARLGDVIEFVPEDGVAKMTRIKENSPLEMLTCSVADSPEIRELLSGIESSGGRIEKAFGGTRLLHVPREMLGEVRDRLERLEG